MWPGLRQDVIRFCRSCDVCQRTVKRGSVRKVPLGSMPLIDSPFKRVAVDIVGPIAPPREAGHRYILTLVDYATRYPEFHSTEAATRYPEAVPLKKITTEAVAEALLDIYSRVGIPEEVLTDQGTQFMSKCMQEVSRLLSIKGRVLNVVPVDDTDGATVAVAGVIHQDVDPELGEVPDLEGYRQREGVRDVKLGDELPEDQRRVLKDLVRRYPDVFTDMPGETDVI